MRAVIVGSGVAGPVMAMALNKAGIEAEVFEARQRSIDEVGSYFTISPNGLDALDVVGALSLAVEVGFPTRWTIMQNSAQQVLGRIPLGAPLQDGTTALTMKRPRLALALADEASRRGIPIHYGHRLVSAKTTPEGSVVATFEGREQPVTADLLIGADGIHSTTRRLIAPAAPDGRFVGLTNFGGVTMAEQVTTRLEPEAWTFTFGRRAFFGVHPSPRGDAIWFVNAPRAEISPSERRRTTPAQWHEQLTELFGADEGPARELIKTGSLELVGDNTYDLGHVPRWHRSRMIAIGDAAHAPAPSSGQGASLALEDAVVLARSLRDSASVEQAFAAYESLRRERVERIVAYGARSSSAKTPGRFGSALRDVGMRAAFKYFITDTKLAWMYDHRIDWDTSVANR